MTLDLNIHEGRKPKVKTVAELLSELREVLGKADEAWNELEASPTKDSALGLSFALNLACTKAHELVGRLAADERGN